MILVNMQYGLLQMIFILIMIGNGEKIHEYQILYQSKIQITPSLVILSNSKQKEIIQVTYL